MKKILSITASIIGVALTACSGDFPTTANEQSCIQKIDTLYWEAKYYHKYRPNIIVQTENVEWYPVLDTSVVCSEK